MLTKRELFELGQKHIATWCEINGVAPPKVIESDDPRDFGTCAYYRDGEIFICVKACAAIGRAGPAWSYPGYVVDRTPFGVLAHELGHHVDGQHGPAGGVRSHLWRPLDAKPITSYCPNDNEWFAEIFRLFVTNPHLLSELRPETFNLFFNEWPGLAEVRTWREVLANSPRHITAATNKIAKVSR